MVSTTWSKRAKTVYSETWEQATYTWAEATQNWEGWKTVERVPAGTGFLLNEDGGYLLWEDGTKILLGGALWKEISKPITNWK
jgi:hypothetical protein